LPGIAGLSDWECWLANLFRCYNSGTRVCHHFCVNFFGEGRGQALKTKGLVLIVLFVILLAVQVVKAASNDMANEQSSVFSHEDISIESSQQIERLLVSSANAVVAGTITDGILVIDGTVTILPGATVDGKVIVLGGQLRNESGVALEYDTWVVPPGNVSYTRIVLGGLMVLFIITLVMAPCVLWLGFGFLGKLPAAIRVKGRLQEFRRRWPAFYIVFSLAVSASMLLGFSLLAWQTVFRHATGIFDNAFIWVIRYFASPGLDRIMVTITNLGFGFSFGVIVLATVIILAVFRHWVELKGLLICLLGGAILNEILKHLFERSRPEAFHIVAASGFSFPSGHAMVSLCFYGMITFLIVRKRSWRWRMIGAVVAALLVLAIGVSRIYLGVHYPSDVVAGYTAGFTWLSFTIALVMWWEHEREKC